MKTGMSRKARGLSKIGKVFGVALCAALFFLCAAAHAQQARKMARIGYLSNLSGPHPGLAAFREGLHSLGWTEGKNIEIEYRYAGGSAVKLAEQANDLVGLKVDAIIAGAGNAPTIAAKRLTTSIPIVMVAVIDPVGNGLVESLARPGANITGLTFEVTREQAGKNLELLKEAVPQVSRVVILRIANVATHVAYSKEAERVAKSLGVSIRLADVQARNEKGVEEALKVAIGERAHALQVTPNPFLSERRQQIVDFTIKQRLPAIFPTEAFVSEGGLMSYGPRNIETWRRAAVYVDKILKGTKPADLPVEQPMKFELIVSLKAAKQIGVTIAPNLLARADRVIR